MTGRESRDTIVCSRAPSFRIEADGTLVWTEPGFTAAVVPGVVLWTVSLGSSTPGYACRHGTVESRLRRI